MAELVGRSGQPGAPEHTDFLKRSQHEDGYWDEPEEIVSYDPPFWMLPGQYANQVWLTSAISCKLKELGVEQQVDFEKAVAFLRQGWNGERFPEYRHTHWMAMALLCQYDSRSAADMQIMEGCGRILYDTVDKDEGDPGDTISIAYASHLAGDMAKDLFDLSMSKVSGYQQEDGGWVTGHGEKHRASFTIEALYLYKRVGMT